MAIYFIFPLIGGIAAAVFVWLLGMRKISTAGLVFGALAFIISVVVVQNWIRQLSIAVALALRLQRLGVAGVVGLSLWLGFVAGAVQTLFKYLFISPVLKRSYRGALSVGLAFGLAEAAFTAVLLLSVAAGIPGVSVRTIVASAVASALERFSATLFHVGTSLYIADAARRGAALRGVLTVIIIHGFADSAVALYQMTQAFTALVLAEVAVAMGLLIGLLLAYELRGRVLEEVQTR